MYKIKYNIIKIADLPIGFRVGPHMHIGHRRDSIQLPYPQNYGLNCLLKRIGVGPLGGVSVPKGCSCDYFARESLPRPLPPSSEADRGPPAGPNVYRPDTGDEFERDCRRVGPRRRLDIRPSSTDYGHRHVLFRTKEACGAQNCSRIFFCIFLHNIFFSDLPNCFPSSFTAVLVCHQRLCFAHHRPIDSPIDTPSHPSIVRRPLRLTVGVCWSAWCVCFLEVFLCVRKCGVSLLVCFCVPVCAREREPVCGCPYPFASSHVCECV